MYGHTTSLKFSCRHSHTGNCSIPCIPVYCTTRKSSDSSTASGNCIAPSTSWVTSSSVCPHRAHDDSVFERSYCCANSHSSKHFAQSILQLLMFSHWGHICIHAQRHNVMPGHVCRRIVISRERCWTDASPPCLIRLPKVMTCPRCPGHRWRRR